MGSAVCWCAGGLPWHEPCFNFGPYPRPGGRPQRGRTVRKILVLVTFALLSASAAMAQFPCTSDPQCSDNNVCNGAEKCQAGVCVAGTPMQCADTDPCTLDSCNSMFGCQHG